MSNLKTWLDERGIKQSWLADKTGLNQGWLSKVANGKAKPNVYDAQKIANALGVPISELWPLPPKEAE